MSSAKPPAPASKGRATTPADPSPQTPRPPAPAPAPEARPRRPRRTRPRHRETSAEARRQGSAILEVLGGLRTPTEASQLLGISPQRYYKLEERAVRGLLEALDERRKPGRKTAPERELERVTAERDRLRRELLRAQALVRVAQRTVGLSPPPSREPAKAGAKGAAKGKGKRKRRPQVRARKLAADLREGTTSPAAPAPPPPARPAQPQATP